MEQAAIAPSIFEASPEAKLLATKQHNQFYNRAPMLTHRVEANNIEMFREEKRRLVAHFNHLVQSAPLGAFNFESIKDTLKRIKDRRSEEDRIIERIKQLDRAIEIEALKEVIAARKEMLARDAEYNKRVQVHDRQRAKHQRQSIAQAEKQLARLLK